MDFIKAFCPVSNQYYMLRVEKNARGQYEVSDFAPLDSNVARSITSNVTAPGIRTAFNLLPCSAQTRDTRLVAACSKVEKKADVCRHGGKYNFQCIYCDKLQIMKKDDLPEDFDVHDVGKTVEIGNGMEITISDIGERAIEEVYVSTYWRLPLLSRIDIDASTVLKYENGNYDLIYYGNRTHSSGCIYYREDNLTGGLGTNAQDSEGMRIFLRKVPKNCEAIFFILNIFSGARSFENVKDLSIRLKDAKSSKNLVVYNLQNIDSSCSGLIVGKMYKKAGRWVFKAIGRSVHEDDVHALASRYLD